MHLRLKDYKKMVCALCFAACFALLSGAAMAASQSAYPPLDIQLDVQRMGDTQAYYVLGRAAVPDHQNAGFTSNAGFVITREGVVVFDALGTPALGKALIAAIREKTDKPIRYVVVSHYHADHMYGLQAFRDETSAVIVADNVARQYKSTLDAGKRLKQRQEALSPWVNADTRIVEPDVTFDDEMIITLGDSMFHLEYAGPAHAPGDIMMMVTPGRTLFAGDIVQNKRVPFMNSDEVDTRNWLVALDTVASMNPAHIIPGHGEPSDDSTQAIRFTGDYIRFVRSHMKDAVEQWQPFEQAYDAVDWSKYSALPAFKQSNRGNAYRVFLEMQSESLDQ